MYKNKIIPRHIYHISLLLFTVCSITDFLLKSGITLVSPSNSNSCVKILTSGFVGFFEKSILKTMSNLFAASSGQSIKTVVIHLNYLLN
jgi:hypothetical protein